MTSKEITILNRWKTKIEGLIDGQAGTYPKLEACGKNNIIIGRIKFNPKKYYNGMGVLLSPESESIVPYVLTQREDRFTSRWEIVAGENLPNPVEDCADLADDVKKYILANNNLTDAGGDTLCQWEEDTLEVDYYVEEASEGNIMVGVINVTYVYAIDNTFMA